MHVIAFVVIDAGVDDGGDVVMQTGVSFVLSLPLPLRPRLQLPPPSPRPPPLLLMMLVVLVLKMWLVLVPPLVLLAVTNR